MKSEAGEQFRERFNILQTQGRSWQVRRACIAPQDPLHRYLGRGWSRPLLCDNDLWGWQFSCLRDTPDL